MFLVETKKTLNSLLYINQLFFLRFFCSLDLNFGKINANFVKTKESAKTMFNLV